MGINKVTQGLLRCLTFRVVLFCPLVSEKGYTQDLYPLKKGTAVEKAGGEWDEKR